MSTQIANSDMLQGFAQLRREYRRGGNDPWEVIGQSDELHVAGPNGLGISIKQRLNQPPVLVASNKESSRVIWDPNPQFKDLDLGHVKVYAWDAEFR